MLKPFVLPSPLYHEPLHQICPLEPESASTQAAKTNHIISLPVLSGMGKGEKKSLVLTARSDRPSSESPVRARIELARRADYIVAVVGTLQ